MQNNNLNLNIDIDSAWSSFLENSQVTSKLKINNIQSTCIKTDKAPKGTDIYISTKTIITYLSHPIDLNTVFWKIQINPYHLPVNGIIKKQMKFNFLSEQSLLEIQEQLKNNNNVEQHILTQIINPEGRIKFKDIRKISIGLCNKDITSYRSKKKSAFYNCFVVIMRIYHINKFREIHIKIFNTGKLEIPGITCEILLSKVIKLLITILKPLTQIDNLEYNKNHCETVLINSNFNCGFYINREILFDILKYKYHINSLFDSCSYPGIQCKYCYEDTDGTPCKVSFMIFRTGSVLIVGKCEEEKLYEIYDYIKNLLQTEYHNICVASTEDNKLVQKKKKMKKKTIIFDSKILTCQSE